MVQARQGRPDMRHETANYLYEIGNLHDVALISVNRLEQAQVRCKHIW